MNNWEFDCTISRGLNHIEWGTPCEDSVKVCQKNGCILAALSDGVGSTESPEFASMIAVDVTLEFLDKFSQDSKRLELLAKNKGFSDNNEYNFKQLLMQKIHIAMKENPLSDATLVFLLVSPEYRVALTGYLGDSAVCVLKRDGSSELYTQRRRHGGATESVGIENAEDYLELEILELDDGIAGILLTSDGMEDIIYQKNDLTALKETELYANALFRHDAKQLEKLLKEVQEEGRTADDISLAAVMREEVSLTEDPTWRCSCGKYNVLDDISCPVCGTLKFRLYSDVRDRIRNSFNNSSTEFFRYLNAHPDEEEAYLRSKGAVFLTSEEKPDTTDGPADSEDTKTSETIAGAQDAPQEYTNNPDAVARYTVRDRQDTFYTDSDDGIGYSGGVYHEKAAPYAQRRGSETEMIYEAVTDGSLYNNQISRDTKRKKILKRTLLISGAVLSGIILTLLTVKSLSLLTGFFQEAGSETVPETTVLQTIATTEPTTENAVTQSTTATVESDSSAPASPASDSAVVLQNSMLFSSPNDGVVIAFVNAYDMVTVLDTVYEDGELWYYVRTFANNEGYLSAEVLATGSSPAKSDNDD